MFGGGEEDSQLAGRQEKQRQGLKKRMCALPVYPAGPPLWRWGVSLEGALVFFVRWRLNSPYMFFVRFYLPPPSLSLGMVLYRHRVSTPLH